MSGAEWATIIVALIGAIAGVGALIRQWRRDSPDIAEKYEAMADRQATKIKEMQIEIDDLKCEVRELKEQRAQQELREEEWAAGIRLLVDQLLANQLSPIWIPGGAYKDRDARHDHPSRPRPK